MDSPWWSSGVFTLAGVALAQLGTWLQGNRERQFKRDEAERERLAKRQDVRHEAYLRFVNQCRKAQVAPNLVEMTNLWQLVGDIRILGSQETYQRAQSIVEKVSALPNVDVQTTKQIEEIRVAGDRQRVLGVPLVKQYLEQSQAINLYIDEFCKAVRIELGYSD